MATSNVIVAHRRAATVSAVPRFIARATEAVHAIVPGLPMFVVAHLGYPQGRQESKWKIGQTR
jgi:hypothetical protein